MPSLPQSFARLRAARPSPLGTAARRKMGCGSSAPAEPTGGDGGTSTEDIDMSISGANGKEKRMSMTKRRVAVRAEKEDEYDPDADAAETIPKSAEEKDLIMKAIKKTEIFSSCTTEQCEFLIKHATGLGVESGETVIQQGEAGDHFYIVHSGVYVATLMQADDQVVATYGVSDSFGELALLYNAPRAATVTCKDAGKVWAIERKKFRYVMVQTGMSNMQKRMDGFLKSVSLLSVLTDPQRAALAEKLEEVPFKDGEYVVAVGDIADAMFFVKSGEVVATVGTDKKEVARYHAGVAFGESCLQPTPETAVRQANIVAVGDVTLLKLSASTFKEMLGDLTEITSRNFKRKVLESVEIESHQVYKEMAHDVQEDLLDALTDKTFEPGQAVIEQGKESNTFYIIHAGKADVVQAGAPGVAEGETRVLTTLEAPGYFGEHGILSGEAANSSIIAGDEGLKLYALDRDSFQKAFGNTLRSLLDAVSKKREIEASKPDLPKYTDLELRRILGVGTFGRVKLVLHKKTNTPYALKCMRKAQVVATKQQSHVLNEKNILAMMEHPFILALVTTYQDAGELYMLLELALGGELFTLLAKRAPLYDKPARFYVACVVSMFSYMHALKVIYRDLKPENLLLDKDGYLKLVDFGFAKILQDRTWTLCGTPEYLAPEIILNKGHGFGADWWCVGILSFECLTGTTPFVSNDPMEGYRKIIKCRVPWPASFQALAKDFIDRLLTVDPTRRLGCLKGGSKDLRSHPWFEHLDWKALEAKQLPAPYKPTIKNQTDDSNFDQYTDEGKLNYPQEDFPKDMFKDFASEWV